jgi:PAS domain S-box-containing protein
MLHPGDRERVMASLARRRATGEPLAEEYRLVRDDGEVRYWHSRATVLRGADGGSDVWIGASRDITQENQHEAATAQLAAIVECSEAAIMSVNLDGIFEIWNSAAERIFGYTAKEVIGEHFSMMLPPELVAEQNAVLRAIAAGESVRNKESVRRAKNGERIEVMITASPLRNSSGAIVSMAAIMNDITQRKQLERQLAQAQRLESIGQLAAGVAHEINTPIQFIGDNIQFLNDSFAELEVLLMCYQELLEAARAGSVAPDLVAAVEGLVESADVEYLRAEIPKSIKQSMEGIGRIAAIVKAIREFSHPGSTEKVPVDLNSAVENTALVSRNEWKYVADLKTELDRSLPAVCCVPGELNQVMLNLIVNAAHAIADKVSHNPGSKGEITVSTRGDGDWVEVRVTDTGTGIPEAARANVFNPFFTTKPVGKGTGQGLAIAHTVIVQKHRGTIRFETELGVGTTFIIRLPMSEGGRETMQPAA